MPIFCSHDIRVERPIADDLLDIQEIKKDVWKRKNVNPECVLFSIYISHNGCH